MHLVLGRTYTPFGTYETSQVSDPLTLELGETNDTLPLLSWTDETFGADVWILGGETRKSADSSSQLDQLGARLGFTGQLGATTMEASLSWQNSIGTAAGPTDALDTKATDLDALIPGMAAHFLVQHGPVTFLTEYVGAMDSFASDELSWNGRGAQLRALNVETAVELELWHQPLVAGISYQRSQQALALGFSQQIWSGTISTRLAEGTNLSMEIRKNRDYALTDIATDGTGSLLRGSGQSGHTTTLQLASEF